MSFQWSLDKELCFGKITILEAIIISDSGHGAHGVPSKTCVV
jgi:hypothetical protein